MLDIIGIIVCSILPIYIIIFIVGLIRKKELKPTYPQPYLDWDKS